MCSFGSCQTRFEFLSQFKKVRNAFECFVTQVQTHLPKTKRVWPMKINVICTIYSPADLGIRPASSASPSEPSTGIILNIHFSQQLKDIFSAIIYSIFIWSLYFWSASLIGLFVLSTPTHNLLRTINVTYKNKCRD